MRYSILKGSQQVPVSAQWLSATGPGSSIREGCQDPSSSEGIARIPVVM